MYYSLRFLKRWSTWPAMMEANQRMSSVESLPQDFWECGGATRIWQRPRGQNDKLIYLNEFCRFFHHDDILQLCSHDFSSQKWLSTAASCWVLPYIKSFGGSWTCFWLFVFRAGLCSGWFAGSKIKKLAACLWNLPHAWKQKKNKQKNEVASKGGVDIRLEVLSNTQARCLSPLWHHTGQIRLAVSARAYW